MTCCGYYTVAQLSSWNWNHPSVTILGATLHLTRYGAWLLSADCL